MADPVTLHEKQSSLTGFVIAVAAAAVAVSAAVTAIAGLADAVDAGPVAGAA